MDAFSVDDFLQIILKIRMGISCDYKLNFAFAILDQFNYRANGIFLSQDAPFGATFTASSGGLTATGLGGLIEGRATIVVLHFETLAGQ